MVTVTSWLLRYAAGRWPAATRDESLEEWTAEVRTIASDQHRSAFHRNRMMLGFGLSLALSRAGGERVSLGWRRAAQMAAIVVGYLALLTLMRNGWIRVTTSAGNDWRWAADGPDGLGQIANAVIVVVPLALVVPAGLRLGRGFPPGVARGRSVGLGLIAVVAVWMGAVPSTMSDTLGSQTTSTVTSWIGWLLAFVVLAPVLRRIARSRRTVWRLLGGAGVTGLVAGVSIAAGTFFQSGPGKAPFDQMWSWMPHWLAPAQAFTIPGGDLIFFTRRIFYSSAYPHVLLAVAAFGVAFLLANNRQPALVANGLGIESSSRRV